MEDSKKEEFKKTFASVKHTMAIEGLIIPPAIEELIFKEAIGEITFEEFSKQLRDLANKDD